MKEIVIVVQPQDVGGLVSSIILSHPEQWTYSAGGS